MAVKITDECIACEACESECPVAAILADGNEKNPKTNTINNKIYASIKTLLFQNLHLL